VTTDVHAGRPAERWGADPSVARLAVLGVHGRTQSPAFVAGLAERVGLSETTWLLPEAADGSWYPARFQEPVSANEPHLTSALAVVDRARAQLAQEGFGADRLVLLGFSQGACLLAEHLVRGATPCAGAALLTGAHLGPPDVPRPPVGHLAGMPVFLGLPEHDSWVPFERARATAELLAQMGAQVELEAYDEPEHVVTDEAVAGVRRLLQGLLG
jgi:phospholipase/carboxylesterase